MMTFLIAFMAAGSSWTGNVFCKDATHCGMGYEIKPPAVSPNALPNCDSFSLSSQRSLNSAASGKTLTVTCGPDTKHAGKFRLFANTN